MKLLPLPVSYFNFPLRHVSFSIPTSINMTADGSFLIHVSGYFQTENSCHCFVFQYFLLNLFDYLLSLFYLFSLSRIYIGLFELSEMNLRDFNFFLLSKFYFLCFQVLQFDRFPHLVLLWNIFLKYLVTFDCACLFMNEWLGGLL